MHPFKRICYALAGAALGAATVAGQVETSTSIRGLVSDSSGAAVPGAAVTIHNQATAEERRGTTGATGSYTFPSVVPGTYDVTVTHKGFKRAVVTGRVAQVGQPAQVDFMLQVGDTTESITISAQGAELITTTSAEISNTVGREMVENLPLNGRNFFDLAVALPHVAPQDGAADSGFGALAFNRAFGQSVSSPLFRASGVFAAGNRDSATNVSIDGVNVQSSVYGQSPPQQPPSAIEELKTHISTMSAEFGNGAAAVTVTTKSGGNRFRGEIYEFLRNDKTDANYFFNNVSRQPKPPYRQNQFGGALGGPVIRDKVFFFAAYEGFRVRRATASNEGVPPEAFREGDFSGTTATIYNPFAYDERTGLRQPFAGNRIPKSMFDPVTQKFLDKFVAHPNGMLNNTPRLFGQASTILNQDQGILRIDWSGSPVTRIYGRWTRSQSPSVRRDLQILEGETNDGYTQNAVLHFSKVLSPLTVSDTFVGYARPKWFLGRPIDVPDAAPEIGLLNTPAMGGGPIFAGTGYSLNQSSQTLSDAVENLYQLGEDLTHVRNQHSFKFGAQAWNRRLYFRRDPNNKGYFTFSPRFTSACPSGNSACDAARRAAGLATGGNGFAEFLLGIPSTVLFQSNSATFHGHRMYYGVYAQDSWRATGRLTVNYGIRWEYWSPWLLPRNTVFTYDEITGTIQYLLKNPLDYLSVEKGFGRSAELNPGIPRAGYTTGNRNFGPRVGLAYALTQKTVLRAGYGIYFDANVNVMQFSDLQAGVSPFFLRHEVSTSAGDQLPTIRVNGSFPFPGVTTMPYPNANPPFSFRYAKPYYPAGSIQQWSASIQHRISAEWAAEISYSGTHAIHLQQFIDSNSAALPQGVLASLSLQQRRRHPEWGSTGTWAPIGFGRYNGGSLSVRNNSWHGLTLLSSFTFAKNLVSSYLGVSDHGNTDFRVPYIWEGPSRLTARLRFVNSLTYSLPFGRRGRGGPKAITALVSGWSIGANTDTTTGIPNRVITSDYTGTGYNGSPHPNRTCDPRDVPGGRGIRQWYNVSCFSQPAFGTWGNSPLGVFEDPGRANLNLSIAKALPVGLTEAGRVQFRLEMFNALNHAQFGPAANNVTPSVTSAGQISSTRPPRQMQFSLRYFF